MTHRGNFLKNLFSIGLSLVIGASMAQSESIAVSAEGTTYNAKGEEAELPSRITDYSLQYILNHYNLFLSGNYEGTHVVGPVVIGGTSTRYRTTNANISYGGLDAATNGGVSYVAENSSYIGSPYLNTTFSITTNNENLPLILGMDAYNNIQNGIGAVTSISISNGGSGISFWSNDLENNKNMLYFSDEFVDFTHMEDIRNELLAINNYSKNIIVDENKTDATLENDHYTIFGDTMVIQSGYSYKLSEAFASKLGSYYVAVQYMNNSNSGTATLCIDNTGTVSLPQVIGLQAKENNTNGTGILFSLPNAETVQYNSAERSKVGHETVSLGDFTINNNDYITGSMFGHVAAPMADVTIDAGDYNGCVIAKSCISMGGEGHMWPYGSKWIYDEENSSITITKTDGTKQIDGASFGIYTSADTSGEPIYSFDAGLAVISTADDWIQSYIPAANETGTLYLKETAAPDGYEMDTKVYTISLSTNETTENGKTTTARQISINNSDNISIANKKIETETVNNKITITKTDGTDRIDGASFGIYTSADASGEPIYSFDAGQAVISTADDWIQSYIPAANETGTLYLKETAAPDGYEMDTKVYTISLSTNETTENGKTTTARQISINNSDNISIANKKTEIKTETVNNKITITKTDGTKQIDGASFGIYTSADTSGEPIYSFDAGLAVISTADDWIQSYIPAANETGTLYLKETAAPDGYEMDTKVYTISLSTNETTENGKTTTARQISINNSDKISIANTPKIQTTAVSVQKVWNNNYGEHPESVDIKLYANGTESGTVTLNQGNAWAHTWKNLPVTDTAGKAIEYTVNEPEVPDGYTCNITGNAAEGFFITNTADQPKEPTTSDDTITVTKTDGTNRLENAEFTIYSDVECTNAIHSFKAGSADISTSDEWIQNYIPAANETSTLYLKETAAPEGYEMSSDTYIITLTTEESEIDGVKNTAHKISVNGNQQLEVINTKKPDEKKSITVNKAWKNDNADIRPESVTVNLLADGTIESTVELNEQNAWENTWTDLDASKSYTVEEKDVPAGYTCTITGNETKGYIITNTLNTDEITNEHSITLTKTDGTEQIEGAAFSIYTDAACTNEIHSFTAGQTVINTSDEWIQSYIPAANETAYLYLKETAAPEGYKLSDTVHAITLKTETNEEMIDGVMTDATDHYITIDDGKDSITIVNEKKDQPTVPDAPDQPETPEEEKSTVPDTPDQTDTSEEETPELPSTDEKETVQTTQNLPETGTETSVETSIEKPQVTAVRNGLPTTSAQETVKSTASVNTGVENRALRYTLLCAAFLAAALLLHGMKHSKE